MMLREYINYNSVVEEMIRKHRDNEVALLSLRDQLAELEEHDGIGAIQYDKELVQTSPTDDTLLNVAIQKQDTEARVNELEAENKMFNRAWEQLSSMERQVLEVYFMQNLKKQDAIDLLCEQLDCETATVYRRRAEAIKHMKRLLFG